jgi:GNAT superfamily N-acetyltransferase
VDHAAVLAAYNEQIRRGTAPDGTGATFEVAGPVIRRLAPPGHDGSGIFWSDLTNANATEVIAEQIRFFADRGESFEWKLFSYDQPSDLGDRLVEAGLVPDDAESLMVAEVAEVTAALGSAAVPDGVRLQRVTGADGVRLITEVQDKVYQRENSELRESLIAQQASAPDLADLVVALAGDEAVCSARIEFLPDADFAGLWGGGTLPEWRGRGIYRALVRYRAELAASRGYRYLTVDASEDSRPILLRVGFSRLATTTPYIWSPA